MIDHLNGTTGRARIRSSCRCLNAIRLLIFAAPIWISWAATDAESAPRREKVSIVLDPSLVRAGGDEERPPAIFTAWLLYARTKLAAASSEAEQRGPRSAAILDDYRVELLARRALADFWRDRKAQETDGDPYLDRLVEIEHAGFLEEYVLGTFAQPGWFIPAADLEQIDLMAFRDWGRQGLDGFISETKAWVQAEGTAAAPVTGSTLKDPAEFSPQRMPCNKSLPRLQKELKTWNKQAQQLRGVALAAGDRGMYLLQLHEVRQDAPYREAGITWVSDRPGWLSYLAGYCSVEAHDQQSAIALLQRATQLLPAATAIRLEYIHTLIATKQFDEADRHLTHVIARSTDQCDLGGAWRRRGFIRFEQGRLEESRTAYERSLKFDPGSTLARSELRLLEVEISRAGGTPSSYQPPAVEQTTTQCSATPASLG